MKTRLGTLQKKIIKFIDSQPYKKCKQSEIRKHFYDPNKDEKSQRNNINRCINSLILPPRKLIKKVKTRDLRLLIEDSEYYKQDKRYYSRLLELDYTKEDVHKI